MKVLITGKDGQLGKSIYKVIPHSKKENEFIFVGRNELDLSDESNINNYFNSHNFDVIINCAAYTAVDRAESEINLADKINHIAVKQLAVIANNQGVKLIHISTDFIFDGKSDKPYIESDNTNPVNNYGKTKLAGESELIKIMPNNAIIIRTGWVYSEFGNNFVDTMLRLGISRDNLKVINDQIGSPTYASDLAIAIVYIIYSGKFLIDTFPTQIYHYTNLGQCSWYEFAKAIFSCSDISCNVSPIPTEEYPLPAKRPKYSVLNKDKIVKTFNLSIPKWEESLKQCIKLKK
jgi:dTDP-4-dehydrorhamnose reductase